MTGIIKTDQLQGAQSSTITVPSGNNLTVGGTLGVTGETTLATHLNLGDNDKIKLGASGDLEIYHNGTDSLIADVGTGTLKLYGSTEVAVQDPVNGEYMAKFIRDGAVELYHNNNKKIETTSSGVNITGTMSADNQIFIEGATNDTARVNFGDTDDVDIGFISYNNADNHMQFATNTAERMRINASGLAQFKSSGISAGNQVFQVIDDGATLFQIRAEDGNISFPQAGAGIYLGVTSGTAANLLDDYEEGTWTPTLTDGSGNDATVNSGSTGGTYTKIGRVVAITGRCTTSSVSGLSSLTYVKTLPFAALSGQAGYATLAVSQAFNLNITAGQSVELTISPGDNKAAVRLNDHSAGNTAMSPSEWSDDGYVMFSGVYVTA